MSGDKRSVITDALETLGTLIDERAARDAIHVAVEPVIAGTKLAPGQNVKLVDGVAHYARDVNDGVGIVDPFLHDLVDPGQRFWLLMYPRTITSLRHVWSHPDFDDVADPAPDKNASEAWLRDFCDRSDCPAYETVIAAAIGGYVEVVDEIYGSEAYRIDDYGDGEIFLYFAGRDAHSPIPPEFWDHVETVTGQTVPSGKRATHFTCSC